MVLIAPADKVLVLTVLAGSGTIYTSLATTPTTYRLPTLGQKGSNELPTKGAVKDETANAQANAAEVLGIGMPATLDRDGSSTNEPLVLDGNAPGNGTDTSAPDWFEEASVAGNGTGVFDAAAKRGSDMIKAGQEQEEAIAAMLVVCRLLGSMPATTPETTLKVFRAQIVGYALDFQQAFDWQRSLEKQSPV